MGDGDLPTVTLKLTNKLSQEVRKSAFAFCWEDTNDIALCLLITCQWVLLTSASQWGQSINQFPYLQHIYKKCLKALSKNTDVPVKYLLKGREKKKRGGLRREESIQFSCISVSYYILFVNTCIQIFYIIYYLTLYKTYGCDAVLYSLFLLHLLKVHYVNAELHKLHFLVDGESSGTLSL